jgi:excisionase family DNA binding protein
MNPEEVVVLEQVGVKKPTAARMLDCSLTTVYQMVRDGKLRTFKVGDDDRVLVSSIKELAAGRAPA